MKIRTSETPIGWCAVDDDTYDGAPDAGAAGAMGTGTTEEEAIADLLEQIADKDGSAEK